MLKVWHHCTTKHDLLQKKKNDDSQKTKICKGIALAELISYLEDSRSENDITLNRFKMTNLAQLYEERLKQLGVPVPCRTNTTRLKEKILTAIPDLDEYTEGARDVYLAFKRDIGLAFQKMCEINREKDAMTLARTATLIRRDLLSNRFSFNGSFDTNCEEDSVPKSLLTLVKMILIGPNIESQKASDSSKRAALSIAQLMKYTSKGKGNQTSSSARSYHSRERETPLPMYLGMKVHLKTRKRELVDTLFHLGLSVSYDRLMTISSSLQNSICRLYEEEHVVCPPKFEAGPVHSSSSRQHRPQPKFHNGERIISRNWYLKDRPIRVARLFVFAHRSRTKTRATQANYKIVSYFELQRIFMSSMSNRVEIKQPTAQSESPEKDRPIRVAQLFVFAHRSRTKSRATRVILDIKVLILL